MIRPFVSSREAQARTPASEEGSKPVPSKRSSSASIPKTVPDMKSKLHQKALEEKIQEPEPQFCIFEFEDEKEWMAKP